MLKCLRRWRRSPFRMENVEETLSKLSISGSKDPDSALDSDTIIRNLKRGKYRNVIAVVGAGASVAAGIPDFRTPGTGLYDNLQEYNLPNPQAIFDMDFFIRNPKPFYRLARELLPSPENPCRPTLVHKFLAWLAQEGYLRRIYTQNIDGLEFAAGVPEELVVQAHGGFQGAHCVDCKEEFDVEDLRRVVFEHPQNITDIDKSGDRCLPRKERYPGIPLCHKCEGFVKPDIVFFGENLPERFVQCVKDDFGTMSMRPVADNSMQSVDLCIVVGTSLAVAPVNRIYEMVSSTTPRLLINNKPVGAFVSPSLSLSLRHRSALKYLRAERLGGLGFSGRGAYGYDDEETEDIEREIERLSDSEVATELKNDSPQMFRRIQNDVVILGDCQSICSRILHRCQAKTETKESVGERERETERERERENDSGGERERDADSG